MSTELMIELPKQNALQIFTEERGIEPYLEKIRIEALSLVPDITTKKGRTEIASMAAKVARSKTYLDEAGKDLCDQERAKIEATLSAVLDSRKLIRARLDYLRDEVRKPLTDWENEEEDRKDKIEARIESMQRLPEIGSDSIAIKKHLARLQSTEIDESFGEYTAEAALTRTRSIRDCLSRLDAQVKIENDLKELEELRIKNAEQAQKDHEAKVNLGEIKKYINDGQYKILIEKETKRMQDIEEDVRIADAQYRQRVIEETIQSFMENGLNDLQAVWVTKEIESGKIKNVFIKF